MLQYLHNSENQKFIFNTHEILSIFVEYFISYKHKITEK